MSKIKKFVTFSTLIPIVGSGGYLGYLYAIDLLNAVEKPILGALSSSNPDNTLRYKPSYLNALNRMNQDEVKNVPFADGLKTVKGSYFVIDNINDVIFTNNLVDISQSIKWTCEVEINEKTYSTDSKDMQCQFFQINLLPEKIQKCKEKNNFSLNKSETLTPFSFAHITSNKQLPKKMMFFLSGILPQNKPKKITLKRNGIVYFYISSQKISNFLCNIYSTTSDIEKEKYKKYAFFLVENIPLIKNPPVTNFSKEKLFSGPRLMIRNFSCQIGANYKNQYCDIFSTKKSKKENWNSNDSQTITKITDTKDLENKDDKDEKYFVLKAPNIYGSYNEKLPKKYTNGDIVTLHDKKNVQYNKSFKIISLISYAHQYDSKPNNDN